jgi:AraC-like DNA-binding protein
MDQLSPLFTHFALSARVFYSGRLCGVSGDHDSDDAGHLHVLRRGVLRVTRLKGRPLIIDRPSVLFYPRPCPHRFSADEKIGAEIVCARIHFGAGMLNPLVRALPQLLVLPLEGTKELGPTVDLLFTEAFGESPGRQTAVDRLAEYFLVLVLREAMRARLVKGGVLMGLADPGLAKAITAMHEHPERDWSLEELAKAAGMSRARFAVNFRETVGVTPFDYLADWRIGVAQSLLKRGRPLKIVAPSVGYMSSTALTRAFIQRVGYAPTAWLSRDRSSSAAAEKDILSDGRRNQDGGRNQETKR